MFTHPQIVFEFEKLIQPACRKVTHSYIDLVLFSAWGGVVGGVGIALYLFLNGTIHIKIKYDCNDEHVGVVEINLFSWLTGFSSNTHQGIWEWHENSNTETHTCQPPNSICLTNNFKNETKRQILSFAKQQYSNINNFKHKVQLSEWMNEQILLYHYTFYLPCYGFSHHSDN